LDIVAVSNQLNDIQRKLDKILNSCHTLPLPYEQIRTALERIDQLSNRVDQLQTQLSPPPPSPVMKLSSPTTTRILESSSASTTNGFHHSSKRQVNNALCKQIIFSISR
jgi:hypothetical protein